MLLVGLLVTVAEGANSSREWKAVHASAGGQVARLALVIGNSAYPAAALANPANDAALMAKTLHQVGFAVTQITNADQRTMKQAISAFGGWLNLAGENAVGLFYYAGHGIQARGRNILILVDAAIKSEADLGIYGVSAQELLGTMEFAGNRMNIVIMDACCNNPYNRSFRSAASGLAQMRAPSGSLLAFATAPGDVAADGRGANSPYTLALTREIAVVGQELGTVFKRVAAALKKQSKGQQVPWIQSSITGDFYFKAPITVEGTITPRAGAKAPAAKPALAAVSNETLFWQSIMNSGDASMFEDYLAQYPKGIFAPLARAKIAMLTAGGHQQAAIATPSAPKSSTPATPAVGVFPEQPKPGETFKDCSDCPEMVIVPAGSFRMGSNGGDDREKPVHRVSIPRAFAVAKFEVTRGQFARFARATGHGAGGGCWIYAGSKWEEQASKSWKDSGFTQTNRYPVVCLNWDDARANVDWLSRETGKHYRLLSESEWEYAARGDHVQILMGKHGESRMRQLWEGQVLRPAFEWPRSLAIHGSG